MNKVLSKEQIIPVALYCISISLWYVSHLNKHWFISNSDDNQNKIIQEKKNIILLYSSVTGTSKTLAKQLYGKIQQLNNITNRIQLIPRVVNISEYNEDNLEKENIVIFLCSTCADGTPPPSGTYFMSWLKDMSCDFRVSKDYLSKVKFAGFGLGGLVYGEDNFCTPIKEFSDSMVELGAMELIDNTVINGETVNNVEYGDDQSDLEEKYNHWSNNIVNKLRIMYVMDKSVTPVRTLPVVTKGKDLKQTTDLSQMTLEELKLLPYSRKTKKMIKNLELIEKGAAVDEKGDAIQIVKKKRPKYQDVLNAKKAHEKSKSDISCCESSVTNDCSAAGEVHNRDDGDIEEEEDRINDAFVTMDLQDDTDDESNQDHAEDSDDGMVDVEDLGGVMATSKEQAKSHEMVTNLQRKALTKEGYKIIGTHSAVKVCRWTKNQMRGRGGCYKHSFYGITSYQCMETTPSLACANKCVFCWRHHKNPVGTVWRWKMDEPEQIVKEGILAHQAMINEMRGVPGVVPERLEEAFTVRHCALSLVGEPIMYPRINEMLRMLHEREISSFLVTNGQFPEMIERLEPVTQLYVSIDAASKSSLKAIDRPLFKDYWERYMSSLKYLSKKPQRTVYRMTLVKSWNMGEVEQYGELIEYGTPDFIEIKSVTYCGKSDASSLTMENVPWHTEVCTYAEAIVEYLNKKQSPNCPRYGIATEHQHSCCVLIAREDKFKPNGEWHTWIDYNKFDELIAEYYCKVDAIRKSMLEDLGEEYVTELSRNPQDDVVRMNKMLMDDASTTAENNKRNLGGKLNKYEKLLKEAATAFCATDYMVKTPSWALYNSEERGFDPSENRYRRNKHGVLVENEYRPSGSGCG